jgi:hypothetical protein
MTATREYPAVSPLVTECTEEEVTECTEEEVTECTEEEVTEITETIPHRDHREQRFL